MKAQRDKSIASLDKSSIGMKGKKWDEKALEEMTERDWRIFREDFDIRTKGGRVARPLRTWKEASLSSTLMKAIDSMGYREPSPIQRQAIPIALGHRDVIGIAETGSGKTAAFLLPMLMYLKSVPREQYLSVDEQGPLAIIMAPARELAQQIEAEAQKFCAHTGDVTVSIVGGNSIHEQAYLLRRGAHVVIGTPGRIKDCLENHYLVLNQCSYIILDEADRMIDMGFEPQVKAVLDAMYGQLKSADPDEAARQEAEAAQGKAAFRTTMMYTATMEPAVERLAKDYMRAPATVMIGDQDSVKNRRIVQEVIHVKESQKRSKLLQLLGSGKVETPAIVFVNMKKQCDVVSKFMENGGFDNTVLHGGKTQDLREDALARFKAGEIGYLVATDVAGRGLDIDNVKTVMNYDLPQEISKYTHRIGRTGRAGKDGRALSFWTDADTEILFDLVAYMRSTDQTIPPELARHPDAQSNPRDPGARRRDKVKHVN